MSNKQMKEAFRFHPNVPLGCTSVSFSLPFPPKHWNVRFACGRQSRLELLGVCFVLQRKRLLKKIKMNFGTKVDLSVVLVVLLQHLVSADNEFFNKCPEFNPQNELDIELVRKSPCKFNFSPALTAVTAAKFHPQAALWNFAFFTEGNCSPMCSNNSGANYPNSGDCCTEQTLEYQFSANSRKFIRFQAFGSAPRW